ncbi:MAG: hypothetical protein ACTSQX_05265 [Candidatus Heimdallarchaeota archaeon]
MRKKGLILIIFVFSSFGLLLANNAKVNAELNIGHVKVDDTFSWNVNYDNSYLLGQNYIGQITQTIMQINEDNLIVELSYGTSYSSEMMFPQNALDYLPLGSQLDTLNVPGVEEIMRPISFITTDWEQQCDKWYDRDVLNTFTEVSWTWDRLYSYNGALRSVYIFEAQSINYNFNEPTAMNFSITYSAKNGFMIEYEFRLIGQDSGNYLNVSISLDSSSIGIGWSYWMGIIIAFIPTYGTVTLAGLGTFAVIYIKKRFERLAEEAEEEEYEEDDEELDEFEKVVKEEIKDYSFIRICSFCKAEVPEDSKICPECGGKK